MRKKKATLTAAVAALLVAVALAVGLPVYGRAEATEPTFDPDVTFRTEYGSGYNLVIPRIDATADGETLPVSAVLSRGAEPVATLGVDDAQTKYRLNTLGDYTLTYFCEYGGSTFTKSFAFTVKDMPYFEHALQSAYSIGSELPLSAVAVYKGERKAATATVNGTAATSYRAASIGTVRVTFSATFGEQTYDETTDVTIRVNGYDDLFIGNTGITSVTADVDAPAYMRTDNGVRVMAGSAGAVVRFSNLIDLNALSAQDNLVRFVPLSGEGYFPIKQVYVRLVDAYDPSNTVQWRFYSVTWDAGGATAYAGFNYDGREMGRFNEAGNRFGEVRSDWMTQLPNGTLDIDRAVHKTNRMWFAAQTDYKNKQFFVTSELPAGQDPWLILDADDAAQVGVGREWRGFTTGEVWLELVFDGAGKTGVLISEVAGQSLAGGEIVDTTAPSVLTDYVDDANMPVGRLEQPYPIPAVAKVPDAVEGLLDPSTVSIRLLKMNGILADDITGRIENGAFTPDEAGLYRIEYKAADSSGNESRRYVNFEISAESVDIEVACDLPATAFVGETLTLPDVTVTGMTTLVKRVIEYEYNGRKLDLTPGNDLLLQEAGTLTMRYELVDYVGSRRAATLTTAVSVSPDPVITVRGMPYTAISGKELLLPDFTAYDYNYGASDPRHEPIKSITVNGKSVNADVRKYTVTEHAGSSLTVVYAAGSASVTRTVSVVSPALLSDYFLPASSGAVTPVNTGEYVGFRFNGDLTVKPINPSAVNNFAGFLAAFDVAGTGTVDLYMTDYLRPYKSIFFRADLARRMLTIGGTGTEYPIPAGRLSLRYKSVGQLLAGYGVIRTWTDGTPFDGFSGGVAEIEWRLSGFGQTELKLYTLGMTNLKSSMQGGVPQPFIDNAVPSIVTASSVYDHIPTVGETLTVPAAQGWSALSGTCDVQVTLYNAAGDKVLNRVSANKDYYATVDSYGVWLIEYRVIYADGAADERSLPVTVRSTQPPTVTVNGSFAAAYTLDSTVTIPTVSASGVGECTVFVSLTRPDGAVENYEPGDTLQLRQSGLYRLTVIVSDDWNYTVKQFTWLVQQEGLA